MKHNYYYYFWFQSFAVSNIYSEMLFSKIYFLNK